MLLLTQGDPASISGQITIKAWKHFRHKGPAFTFVADPILVEGHVPTRRVTWDVSEEELNTIFQKALPIIPLRCPVTPVPGCPDPRNASTVLQSIRLCTQRALANPRFAVITNPISKITLQKGGFNHPGHTTWLAELCNAQGQEIMTMVSPTLRTIPLTTHVSLRKAIDILNPSLIEDIGRRAFQELRHSFGIASPRIVCSGLNPHAGEDGLLGNEEETIIKPALARLNKEGIHIRGPLPADTLFTADMRKTYDLALCMYHDQALIPLKTLDMHHGVNVTLGLPIVRTSPDHGTAFDLAKSGGNANPQSLECAILMAQEIQQNRISSLC